jgi:hypothetical protein
MKRRSNWVAALAFATLAGCAPAASTRPPAAPAPPPAATPAGKPAREEVRREETHHVALTFHSALGVPTLDRRFGTRITRGRRARLHRSPDSRIGHSPCSRSARAPRSARDSLAAREALSDDSPVHVYAWREVARWRSRSRQRAPIRHARAARGRGEPVGWEALSRRADLALARGGAARGQSPCGCGAS